jgi:hypothetical protein
MSKQSHNPVVTVRVPPSVVDEIRRLSEFDQERPAVVIRRILRHGIQQERRNQQAETASRG